MTAGRLSGAPQRDRFFERLAQRPFQGSRLLADAPPPVPLTTKVAFESRANYATMAQGHNAIDYGMTGLMVAKPFHTTCYGPLFPGYVLLFPGTWESAPPPYRGAVSLNGTIRDPLRGADGALHAQMCELLQQPTTSFIGFSCRYPFSAPGNVGYASWSCNEYWFGSDLIPVDSGGTDWQRLIRQTLLAWLPHA